MAPEHATISTDAPVMAGSRVHITCDEYYEFEAGGSGSPSPMCLDNSLYEPGAVCVPVPCPDEPSPVPCARHRRGKGGVRARGIIAHPSKKQIQDWEDEADQPSAFDYIPNVFGKITPHCDRTNQAHLCACLRTEACAVIYEDILLHCHHTQEHAYLLHLLKWLHIHTHTHTHILHDCALGVFPFHFHMYHRHTNTCICVRIHTFAMCIFAHNQTHKTHICIQSLYFIHEEALDWRQEDLLLS